MAQGRPTTASRPVKIFYKDRQGKGTPTFNSGSPIEEHEIPKLKRGHSQVHMQDIIYEKRGPAGDGGSGSAFIFQQLEKKHIDQNTVVVKTQIFTMKRRFIKNRELALNEFEVLKKIDKEGVEFFVTERPDYDFKLIKDDSVEPKINEVYIKKCKKGIKCKIYDQDLEEVKEVLLTRTDLEKSKLLRNKGEIDELLGAKISSLMDKKQEFQTKILDELCFLKLVPEYKIHILMKLRKGINLRKYEIGNAIHLMQVFYAVVVAVEALHAMGIIHLDIKPDNIVMESADIANLVDFGISIILNESEPQPMTWQLYWNPQKSTHFDPKLSTPQEAHPRFDVYSLGNLLSHLLTKNRNQIPIKSWYDTQERIAALVNHMMCDAPKRITLPEAKKETKAIYDYLCRKGKGIHDEVIIKKKKERDQKSLVTGVDDLIFALENKKEFVQISTNFMRLLWYPNAKHWDLLKETIEHLKKIRLERIITPEDILIPLNDFRKKVYEDDSDNYLKNFAHIFNRNEHQMKDDITEEMLTEYILSTKGNYPHC